MEDQFIVYYDQLFGLPKDFGIKEIWRTTPNGEIRQPAAGGHAGWHNTFMQERIADAYLRELAINMSRMMRTEADILLLPSNYVILVECKFKGKPSTEQYERHEMMGNTLAKRLDKAFHFGMVVDKERDPKYEKISVPYVLWSEIESKLAGG